MRQWVGVDALDVPRAPQRFQAADVEADEGLGGLALLFEDVANELEVPAWLVDAISFLGHDGDVLVGVSRPGDRRGRLDDHASPDLLDLRGGWQTPCGGLDHPCHRR
jgi:hypothetical protein